MPKIILIENEMLTAATMRAALEQHENYTVPSIYTEGLTFLEVASTLSFDLVLMDIGMPEIDGIALLMQLKEQCPTAKVIMLSSHRDTDNVYLAFQQGASGFISKTSDLSEVFQGVEEVLSGKAPYFSSTIPTDIATQVKKSLTTGIWPKISYITATEKRIVQHLAKGLTTKEIASTLKLSTRTIECHRRNMMEKLDAPNIASLISTLTQRGILNL